MQALPRSPLPPGRSWRSQYACTHHSYTPPPFRARTAVKATTHQPSDELQAALQGSNASWLRQCLDNPLQLGSCKVHVLGVCFFAPEQQSLVSQALQQLEPSEVLVEQAEAAQPELLLPYPAWVAAAMHYEQQCLQATTQQQQQLLQALQAELAASALSPTAKVGKDIIDPFESFGYYAGLDFLRQPSSLPQVLRLCGFLPGQEIAAVGQYALEQGVRLRCIDAPIKLQERWVRGLVSSMRQQLDEQWVNSSTPLKDFNTNQQLAATLGAAAAAWDKQLAETADKLRQDAATAAAGDASAAADAAAAAEQQALLLFKVSKATAAALLPPDEALQAGVMQRLQRLQPLKWKHFALRQQYMAQQIKEAAELAAKQGSSNSGGSSSKQPVLLAVVGRQHCAALRALWSDPTSSLWRTEVPRTFAPSMVESQPQQAQDS